MPGLIDSNTSIWLPSTPLSALGLLLSGVPFHLQHSFERLCITEHARHNRLWRNRCSTFDFHPTEIRSSPQIPMRYRRRYLATLSDDGSLCRHAEIILK